MSDFILAKETLGPHPVLHLQHRDGRSLTVLPHTGAAVQQICLPAHGKSQRLLVPMHTAVEISRNRWSKGNQLLPFPNRVHHGHYSFQGRDYQLPINFKYEGGQAIHGFFCQRQWELTGQNLSEENPWLELSCTARDGHEGYPFPCRARLRLGFDADTFLQDMTLENLGSKDLPAGWGWHPYFRTGTIIDQLKLELPPVRRLRVQDMIPTGDRDIFSDFRSATAIGTRFMDVGLELQKTSGTVHSILTDEAQGIAISLLQDASVCRYLQIFTHPQRHALAMEPMSCAADAFNNGFGLQIVAPHEAFQAGCRIRLDEI